MVLNGMECIHFNPAYSALAVARPSTDALMMVLPCHLQQPRVRCWEFTIALRALLTCAPGVVCLRHDVDDNRRRWKSRRLLVGVPSLGLNTHRSWSSVTYPLTRCKVIGIGLLRRGGPAVDASFGRTRRCTRIVMPSSLPVKTRTEFLTTESAELIHWQIFATAGEALVFSCMSIFPC